MLQRLCCLLFLGLCCATLNAQQGIDAITFDWIDVNNSTNDYTAVSPNNSGQSITANTSYDIRFASTTTTDNNRRLVGYTVNGTDYEFLLEPDTLALRRLGTATRLSLWIEAEDIDNTNDILTLNPERQVPERTLYRASLLNMGYDNVLVNSGTNSSNIERIDAIFRTGMLTSTPADALIPVLDRGANAEFKIAAILSLDANGDPASYGSLVEVNAGDSGGEVLSIGSSVLFLQQSLGQNPIPTGSSTQGVGGVAISFSELGVSANQIIYGYSLFSVDVDAAIHDLADISTFPTNSNNSGLDFGAGAVSAVSSNGNLRKANGPGGYKAALNTWLKANAGITTDTDGSTVTDWQDQSLGNHDAFTLENAPTYRDGSASGLEDVNFNPTVDFLDAVETGLQIANNSDYNVGGEPYTKKSFNITIRTGNNVSTKQQIYEQGDDQRGIDMYIESGNLVVTAYNAPDDSGDGVSSPWNAAASPTTISTSIATDTEYIVTLELDGSATGNGTVTAYLNGQSFGSFGSVGQLADHDDEIGLGDFNSQTGSVTQTECPVTTVISSSGVDNPNNIIGLPDGNFAQVYTNGDIITVDFGQEYPAGTQYEITWRRDAGSTGTAIMVLRESTSSNSGFVDHPSPPQSSQGTFQTDVVTANTAFRYIQITKEDPPSIVDFDLDAIVVSCSPTCPVPTGGVESSGGSGLVTPNNIIGLPDGNFAEFNTNGDIITVDFGEEYPAGTEYDITWRRDPASGTAQMVLRESTSPSSGFVDHTSPPSVATQVPTTVTITSENNFRYLQITKLAANPTDFWVDAIVVDCADENITFDQGDAASFYGSIPEFIYCNEPAALLANQRNRIESYLAIKYGITLDQSTPINYVNSDGDVIFNTSDNASLGGYLEYNSDIAGIGRDDASEFLQLESQSENNNSLVRIARSNSNGIQVDDTWFIWGNDGASATTTDNTDVPPLIQERIERVWRVAERGSMGVTDVSFDITDLGFGTDPNDFSLLIAGNGSGGNFTNASIETGGLISTIDGRTFITFPDINMSDGEYFSLGTGFENCGPGGVNTDLYVWLRANFGTSTLTDNTTLSTWFNQGSGGPDAAADGTPPLYKNNSTDNLNYNATIDFDGTDDRLTFGNLPNIKSGSANGGDYTIISAGIRDDSDINYILGGTGGTNNEDLHYGYRSNTEATLAHWGNDINLSVNAFDNPQSPFILLGEYDGSNRVLEEIRGNDFNRTSGANTTDLSGTKDVFIGERSGNLNYNGRISELIIFDNDITDLEKNQIYTYLSLKYGITLTDNLDNDGTSNETISGSVNEGDYVLSDGSTVVWTYSDKSTYHNDVAGVVRDDDSCLSQRQSRSEGENGIVSMGLGSIEATNADNNNSFSADKSALVWGHDGTAANTTQTNDVPGTVTERLSRIWRVEETGTVGNMQLSFDISGLGLSSNPTDYQLIISGSNTMANGDTFSGATLNGNTLTFDNVDFTDGDYFTLGVDRTTCGPGGVSTDLALWLRADAGTNTTVNGESVTSWIDQSVNSNNASEDNAGGGFPVEPFLVTNAVNNNPVIRFTDSENTNNSWLETGSNTSTGNLSIISVFKTAQSEGSATNFTDSPALVSAETGGATDDWALGISQGRLYVNATTNNAYNIRPVTTYTDNVARIATATRVQASNGSGINLYVNSANVGSATSNATPLDAAGTIAIGNHSGYDIDGQYDGDIGEVIVFDQVLSATDRARVESYLSVKYGITRTVSGLSEAAEDYLAADGGIIWDIDAQGVTYHNDIFGIGRDDNGCFLQEKSKSINSDALVTFEVNDALTSDDSYLISGNDNAVLEQANNPEKPAGIASRLNREWKVQETGTVGEITLTYDVSTITGPNGVGTNNLNLIRLLVDDDGDFSSEATVIQPSSINAAAKTVSFIVDLTNGQYYTLGSTEVAALPVELVSFTAKAIENSIQLNWMTASEDNNSHFEIQRSTNGINFQTIGAVQGNGTSQGSSFYEFIDESPFQGYSYYRLMQVDLNGEFTLTEIKSVYLEFKETRSTYLAYPNPVNQGETVRLRYETDINKTVKVQVFDLKGFLLIDQAIELNTNQQSISLDTNKLSRGVNLIKITDANNKITTLKLIVR